MGKRSHNPNVDFLIDLMRASLLGETLPPIPQGCTPDAMNTLIRKQQLTNLVYLTVAATPRLEPLRRLLEKDYLVQIPKTTNQDVEIRNWLAAADAKGLDCIPLKGFLLRQLYPNPMMRSMTDLDVLMKDMDRQDVRAWMEGMGYVGEETHVLSHHDNYTKAPWMYMELHTHLMKPRPGRDELEAKVWQHATLMPGYRHIYQMSPEDFYIFHVLHLHKHFVSRGVGLKSVIDIHVFLEKFSDRLDRAYVQQELKALQIEDFTAYMERLARLLLGDEPADDDLKLVADYMANCTSFGTAEGYHVIRMAQEQSRNGKSRLMYRVKSLFPKAEIMHKVFPVLDKHPYLLPFCWIARFFKKKKHHQHTSLKNISQETTDAVSHIFKVTKA